MSLRLGDIAPDFKAKQILAILAFMNTLEIVGEFYFHTQPTLHLYVPPN